jgi:hypothetical protein
MTRGSNALTVCALTPVLNLGFGVDAVDHASGRQRLSSNMQGVPQSRASLTKKATQKAGKSAAIRQARVVRLAVPDWLVERAVLRELVSGSSSLIIRENTGKTTPKRGFARCMTVAKPLAASVFWTTSLLVGTGNIFGGSGNCILRNREHRTSNHQLPNRKPQTAADGTMA